MNTVLRIVTTFEVVDRSREAQLQMCNSPSIMCNLTQNTCLENVMFISALNCPVLIMRNEWMNMDFGPSVQIYGKLGHENLLVMMVR